MKKYVLERRNNFLEENRFNAGSKARNDITEILSGFGFEDSIINLKEGRITKYIDMISLKGKLNDIESDSIIVVQYPFSWNIITSKLLKILKDKNCKTIALIHDIDSLRYSKLNNRKKEEINILNMFDIIICHNDYMKQWLIDNKIITSCISLNLFDYIVQNSEEVLLNDFENNNIIFAGNLSSEKSGFIYKIKDVKINLYGANLDRENIGENINYLGKFDPNNLPNFPKGGYGLIWDGNSIETCEGDTGEYLKYNNPHKLSLYMAAGLPVIAWSKAAISKFVIENNVGFLIDDLNEIDKKIEINKNNYKEFCINSRKIKEKVTNGEYTIKSIEKAINRII